MFIGCSTCCGDGPCTDKVFIVGFTNCFDGSAGGYGIEKRIYTYPPEAGKIGLSYDAYSIPDKFSIYINGEQVATTGYVGDNGWGIDVEGPGQGCLVVDKPAGVTEIEVEVEAPLVQTGWRYNLSCLAVDNISKQYDFYTGINAGEMSIAIRDIDNTNFFCGQDVATGFVDIRVVDADNTSNVLLRGSIDLSVPADQGGDRYLTFFKPYGIKNVIIYVTVSGMGAGQSFELRVSCPEVIDPPEPPPEEDTEDGDIVDPNRPPDIVQPVDPPVHNDGDGGGGGGGGGGNGRAIGVIGPPPNNGGFNFGNIGGGCTVQTMHNYNEPICYAINASGYYISRDPDIYTYFSASYPTQSGKIIVKCNSYKAVDPTKPNPTREIVIWGFGPTIQQPRLLLDKTTLPTLEEEDNNCFVIEKPEGVTSVKFYLRENNPDLVNALLTLDASCLITDEGNQFEENIKTFNIGSLSGLVDFYASVFMAEDAFLDCASLNSIPKARFIVSDGNNVLLDFTLQPDDPGGRLDKDNTFIDKVTSFFKSTSMTQATVKVIYSRNAVFRWTMGCPRFNCFSICNQEDVPQQIVLEIEASEYYFRFNRLGIGIWSYQNQNQHIGYSTFDLDFDPRPLYNRGDFAMVFVKNIQFSAIWGVKGDLYNGNITLSLDDSKTFYEYVFNDPYTCPEGGSPSSIRLQTDGTSCGLWLNNIKALWRFGPPFPPGQAILTPDLCSSDIDIFNQSFEGHSCLTSTAIVGCNNLFDGAELNASIPYTLYNLQSFYDYAFSLNFFDEWRNFGRYTDAFGTMVCDPDNLNLNKAGNIVRPPFPLIQGSRNYDLYRDYRGQLLGFSPEDRRYETSDYKFANPPFRLPNYGSTNGQGVSAKLKSITEEVGKPYMVVKSIRAV